jgi:hypothetical protein
MGIESFNSTPKNKTEVTPTPEERNLYGENSADTGEDELEKAVDNQELLAEYQARNEQLDQNLEALDNQLHNLLNAEPGDLLADLPTLNELLDKREELQREKVQASANYPGDWTAVLQRRMLDPVTKDKFITQKTEAMVAMKTGEPDPAEVGNKYGKKYASHYQAQIDSYDQRVKDIFNSTDIEHASASAKYHLGRGNINQPGTVYLNAESRKSGPLTIRQKNIIEAHEKGHGLRDFQSALEKPEIQSVIDQEALDDLGAERAGSDTAGRERFRSDYLAKPEEIIERMAQFKNYFRMNATDTFTSEHLAHIRAHYVHDTGLDNGVNDLLRCVTPNTEQSFLAIMNKYPI